MNTISVVRGGPRLGHRPSATVPCDLMFRYSGHKGGLPGSETFLEETENTLDGGADCLVLRAGVNFALVISSVTRPDGRPRRGESS